VFRVKDTRKTVDQTKFWQNDSDLQGRPPPVLAVSQDAPYLAVLLEKRENLSMRGIGYHPHDGLTFIL
jgi:hypothetical protein